MNCTIRAVIVLLFFAAAIGGGLNAVAGGGSFLTLPSLIFAGVSPVVANATSTLALWPASISSTFAYRGDIKTSPRWLVILGLTSVAGGLAGALLLVRTSDSSFLRLLPWLMLVAAATFTFGSKLRPKRTTGGVHRFEHIGGQLFQRRRKGFDWVAASLQDFFIVWVLDL